MCSASTREEGGNYSKLNRDTLLRIKLLVQIEISKKNRKRIRERKDNRYWKENKNIRNKEREI